MKKITKIAFALFLASLTLNAAAQNQAQEKPAMEELSSEAGSVALPPAPPVTAKPVSEQPKKINKTTILCTMNLNYVEHVQHLIVLKIYKKSRGKATVFCDS